MSEEQAQQPEEQQQPSLADHLKQYPNAPTQEQIDQWKLQFGGVFVSGFSEEELYVWRALLRPEYRKIQELASDAENPLDQFQVEEAICDTCILWRSVDKAWDQGKAGVPQTLSEQIMNNSGFLSPAAATMLVAKL